VLHFVVRRPLGEADPAPLSAARWDWIVQRFGAQRISQADKASIAEAVGGRRTGRELFLPMIAAVGGLILLEMILTRIWATQA
jgi:hypothetical protein